MRHRFWPLERFPGAHGGRQYLPLRHPAGHTSGVVLRPMVLARTLALIDRVHAIVDIQAAVMRARGELVTAQMIEALAERLDAQGFLDSPHFAERRATVDRAFLDAPRRPAAHMGGAYAAEPEALRHDMDAFFT